MAVAPELLARHPWLAVTTTVEDYVAPDYYDRILKEYVFKGRSDLDLFADFARHTPAGGRALELGCGTGRATNVFLRENRFARLDLVDLSPRMLDRVRERFAGDGRIRTAEFDAIRFLENATDAYDVVYTLWSFSHAVHQWMTRLGLQDGWHAVQAVMERFVRRNLRSGSRFFLIHFDSRSDEQRILLQQWKKIFPIFSDTDLQSPSQRCLEEVFSRLAAEGVIEVSVTHHVGEPIVYASLEEALEIFMNFHMESYFNESPMAADIIDELSAYFAGYRRSDGTIAIAPGCFLYSFTKLSD